MESLRTAFMADEDIKKNVAIAKQRMHMDVDGHEYASAFAENWWNKNAKKFLFGMDIKGIIAEKISFLEYAKNMILQMIEEETIIEEKPAAETNTFQETIDTQEKIDHTNIPNEIKQGEWVFVESLFGKKAVYHKENFIITVEGKDHSAWRIIQRNGELISSSMYNTFFEDAQKKALAFVDSLLTYEKC